MTGLRGAIAGGWAALLLLALAGCSEEKVATPDGGTPSPFVLGEVTAVTLDLPAGSHWDAPNAGPCLLFPEGAHGTLRFARIVDGPAAPWPGGSGFHVSYAGSEPVELRVPHAAGGLECLLAYGTPRGCWSDGPGTRWFALPAAAGGASDSLDLRFVLRPRTGSEFCESSLYYWLQCFSAGAAEIDSLDAAVEIARGFLAAWLDSLDEPLRDACRQRMEGELAPTFYPDGDYYAGFFRRCGSAPLPQPRIGLRAGATRSEIAHQVGHYVTHLLVGNDAYAALEDAGDDPAIGSLRYDRVGTVEEYARYHEHVFAGGIAGAGDPASPSTFFVPQGSPPTPEAIDVPSLQGYGVLLLRALGRTDPTMTWLTGETRRVPVVGLRYAELAEHVIAPGARTIDGLREVADAYLTSIGRAGALPVLAAATGWRYRGSGSLVDRSGARRPGILVRDRVADGGLEYEAGATPALTDSAGAFAGLALFGGASFLRSTVAGDSFDTAVSVNWLRHTPSECTLATPIPWAYLDQMDKLRIHLELSFATADGDTVPFFFNQVLADSNAVFTPSRIYVDEPYAYPCSGTCWMLDALQIHYDLATGIVDQLSLRIHDLTLRPTHFELRLRQPLQSVMEGTKKVHLARMAGVSADEARAAFAMELTEPDGARHTDVDLRGEDLWIEVRAYCG